MDPTSLIYHLPHSSRHIPEAVRDQFINPERLERELDQVTDVLTDELYVDPETPNVVRFPLSRLVVDVERFDEGMFRYEDRWSNRFRRELSVEEKAWLRKEYFDPHHRRFADLIREVLALRGRCVVLDCHSFDLSVPAPSICLGVGAHTSKEVGAALFTAFSDAGFMTRINVPYGDPRLPPEFYFKSPDPNVSAILIEVNRNLYFDRNTQTRLPQFDQIKDRIRGVIGLAVSKL